MCNCHESSNKVANNSSLPAAAEANKKRKIDEACQTLSTGDIVITKIFFKEELEKSNQKVLTSSPKKQ